MNLLLNREQVDERFVYPGMRVVAPRVQQAAERVLHRAGGRGVDVALGRRQVDDVLAEEEVGDVDPLGIDALQHAHPRFRLVADPAHVLVLEVVEDGHLVALEDRHVVIQVFAFEGVGHDRLVLHADLIAEAAARQRLNRAFELPRRRVGRREREVPRDVVFQNRRLAGRQRRRHPGQLHETIDVGQDAVGCDSEDGDSGLQRF